MTYLTLKALHLFFIIAWFAGLFYLPRLYVNLAMAKDDATYDHLLMMANKLYRFMTPFGLLSLVFGLWVMFAMGVWGAGVVWPHIKITLGLVLVVYHAWCYGLLLRFRTKSNRHSHKWYRVFNEIPVLLLIVALYIVLFKPF
ncbi:MAG: CopD family protein [Neisseriaceae bacterium]|nr:CopD family protein [Neisseriaceae bacterium]